MKGQWRRPLVGLVLVLSPGVFRVGSKLWPRELGTAVRRPGRLSA